jgi:hypothetical protein
MIGLALYNKHMLTMYNGVPLMKGELLQLPKNLTSVVLLALNTILPLSTQWVKLLAKQPQSWFQLSCSPSAGWLTF